VFYVALKRFSEAPLLAGWQSGHAAACKAVNAGSIPTSASKNSTGLLATNSKGFKTIDLRSLSKLGESKINKLASLSFQAW
jgi:hypothetical protein